MSSNFDPYRVWLSIPVSEQPANYYRLLGVDLFESNNDVITRAADRQIMHVRTFLSGPYSKYAQKILNELAVAQVTLLNKSKKDKYDAQLRLKIKASSDSKIDDTIVVELPPPPPSTALSNQSKTHQKKKDAAKPVNKNVNASMTPFIVILLSAMVLELLLFAGFFFYYQGNQPDIILVKAERLYNQSVDLEKEKKYSEALIKISSACELVPENKEYESARQRISDLLESERLVAGSRKTFTINDVEFAFRWCPSGTFTMGSPRSEKGRNDNEDQHQVTLTKGFWMMETEVTQKQWKAVMGKSQTCRFRGDDLPVEQISWGDCQSFCKKCSELGLQVQLPSEAQWEYACRAGTNGAYAGIIDDIAWYDSNSDYKTHPVGQKSPNAWGLYDLSGNVWELCQFRSDDNPDKSVANPTGNSNESTCVRRGGSWGNGATECRSACRFNIVPEYRSFNMGFRCILSNNFKLNSSLTEASTSTNEKKESDNQNKRSDVLKPGDRKVITVNDVDFAFRYCPPGTFLMGSPESEEGRKSNETQHQVTLTKGFWIMEDEVTQTQWKAIMGSNPSYNKGDDLPVGNISWNTSQKFIKKCTVLGMPVQLPTEAQWEYARRAETTSAYTGNQNEAVSDGTTDSNAWGLLHMEGNMTEWCQDWYGPYPTENVTDPQGPENGSKKVLRYGHRAAERDYTSTDNGCDGFGVRFVLSEDPE